VGYTTIFRHFTLELPDDVLVIIMHRKQDSVCRNSQGLKCACFKKVLFIVYMRLYIYKNKLFRLRKRMKVITIK